MSTAKSGEVGKTFVNNLIIRPGTNIYPVEGILNQTLVLNDLDNGFINLTITGTDVINNGQHITYYVSGDLV